METLLFADLDGWLRDWLFFGNNRALLPGGVVLLAVSLVANPSRLQAGDARRKPKRKPISCVSVACRFLLPNEFTHGRRTDAEQLCGFCLVVARPSQRFSE